MRLRTLLCALALLGACGDDADDKPVDRDDVDAGTKSDLDGGSDPVGSKDPGNPNNPGNPVLPGKDGSVTVTSPDGGALTSTLVWKPCGDDQGFECATLTVPVDYANPSVGTVGIALLRVPAKGKRIGSLLWNPGGPGGSAIDSTAGLLESLSDDVRENFDIVSMDPRGVGYSGGLSCHSNLQELYAADPTPDNEKEWNAIDALSEDFADECAGKYAKILPHVGTLDVVRDLDRLREALGEDKLSYLGMSYGTVIGAQYAEMFGERARALVLDGPLDPKLDTYQQLLNQAKGFELALSNFFAWCDDDDDTRCPWTKGKSAAEAFAALQAKVERAPIPAPDSDRDCGPGELSQGTIAMLYLGEEGWEYLAQALADAVAGDGSGLVYNTDFYLDRNDETGEYSNVAEMYSAVTCLDGAAVTVADVRAHEDEFRAAAPNFGVPVLVELLICAHWAVQGKADLPVPTGAKAPPLLVVGTTHDPATPYAGAQAITADLKTAHLLTYDGEGHLAYARGVECIDKAVDAYLIEGTLPDEGAHCADAPPQPLVHGALALKRSVRPRLRR